MSGTAPAIAGFQQRAQYAAQKDRAGINKGPVTISSAPVHYP